MRVQVANETHPSSKRAKGQASMIEIDYNSMLWDKSRTMWLASTGTHNHSIVLPLYGAYSEVAFSAGYISRKTVYRSS